MRLTKKTLGLFVAAAALTVFLSMSGGHTLLVLFDRMALTDFFEEAGHSSIGLFVVAHIVANAVGVPGTLLVIVGGAVYGLWWGTLWSVVGASLGAIAAFCLARYLFSDWFKARFYHKPIFKKLNTALCTNALLCVLTIRFSPVSPFNVVNFAFGLSPVPVRAYAIGTFIGIIPGTLAYTWLGVTGAAALEGNSVVPLVICLLMLMMLSALPLVARGSGKIHL
ncbi:TVP38/TMEM64 family protein [Synechococcus sp. PCC 7335]|uniref:TVP38/TMEM64 family protein n=1 Tax=Synechococcus sp. (strain ATCC 29403 / PCC 7335) TaxID=91464 RepID=UPI001D0CE7B1|nr:TVP38/TMEM64 family protein [Synechococcus sp. PCC 7335]